MQSPGVLIKEKDMTLIVPTVSSTTGGIVGRFKNGPIGVPYLLSSEVELADIFGAPSDKNFPEWFAAAEFLKYSGALYVVRASATDTVTAVQKSGVAVEKRIVLKSQSDFEEKVSQSEEFALGTYGMWASRFPGFIGNSLSVIAVDSGNWSQFLAWSSTNKSKYGIDFSTLFSQEPKTSSWLNNKMMQGTGAKFTVTTVAGSVTAVNVASGGSGYVTGAYIELNGVGTGAKFTPIITDGILSKISLDGAGSAYASAPVVTISAPSAPGGVAATAVCQIGVSGATVGKVISISISNGGSGYTASDTISVTFDSGTASASIPSDSIKKGVITSTTLVSGGINYGTSNVTATAFNASFDDELHVIVLDSTGSISGTVNKVLEVYEGLSKAPDALNAFGTDNYYMTAVNNNSKYVYWIKSPAAGITTFDTVSTSGTKLPWGSRASDVVDSSKKYEVFFGAFSGPAALVGGNDGSTVTDGQIKDAYSLLANVDQYDIACFPCAGFSPDVIKHVIENVAFGRQDAMAFVSPYSVAESDLSVNKYVLLKTPNDIVNFKNIDIAVSDQYSQYAVMDSGWKYIFDKYNNKYRWVPLNGDIAGIVARLELIAEPWFSPGGYDRGGIKNVLKLAFNPVQSERDAIYPKGINPVVVLPGGGGVMLYGDRTMTSKPSAFDRINVRRLFNILEKAIGAMAKYKLFEINDNFTRSDFKSKVENYLRDIQGRRGITEYMVVCDTSNNTPTIIDANEFRASVLIKPTRSINFITLSFVATSTGVSFNTVVGA